MRTICSIYCLLISSFTILGQEVQQGFFDFNWNDDKGTLSLHIAKNQLDMEFLYVSSLSAGIGSNDIGLDRGQLGRERLVKFKKLGNKILLIQSNTDYRAKSANALERKAVEEAFAQSTVWGFEIKETTDSSYTVDMTTFLLQDAHGVAKRLQSSNQGTYKVDASRSAVWMERTRSFPKNTEFEAIISFTGDAKGQFIRSVTPDPDNLTVRQHHSFIELPDHNYKPRAFHPYSGYFDLSYYDYATPIESPLAKRFIYRHRLSKKNPSANISEAVEPIIYYMDPGCPEPIKSALMEGASWWDQAFQSAGYAPGTFQVKELPAGADMLDVRYNVIQWVHRSTRGWSYGASISDPRTGEILKGHVSLGSLRVRQDFLIAQGILSPYNSSDSNHDEMKKLALARLRQLAAHEVGHTIGLAHNFASSVNDRASVMDYPHPHIVLNDKNQIDQKKLYDTKIGDWDKKTIAYGYQDFPAGTVEIKELEKMLYKSQEEGYLFISDSDARASGGANPDAHLWDNGNDIVKELSRMMILRKNALMRFGENSIPTGTPISELEKILVPIYLMQRYQVEAVSKLIGGIQYNYFVKGDKYKHDINPVSNDKQLLAIQAIIETLDPNELALPSHIIKLLPPSAYGYNRDRETFKSRVNPAFDILSPAESYVNETIHMLLHKDRLARIQRHEISGQSPLGLSEYLELLGSNFFSPVFSDPYKKSINQLTQTVFINELLSLSFDKSVDTQVAAIAYGTVRRIANKFLKEDEDHKHMLKLKIDRAQNNPSEWQSIEFNDLPPGSPIGCNH